MYYRDQNLRDFDLSFLLDRYAQIIVAVIGPHGIGNE
jgi:hypothetical protein